MASKHIIVKTRDDGKEPEQVFSDKFSDYGYASYLVDWFNLYNKDYTLTYHLKEVD